MRLSRLATGAALAALAGTALVGTAQPAAAASSCFTDPSGDSENPRDPSAPSDPRADITKVCAENDGTTVTLSLQTAQPTDPAPRITWFIYLNSESTGGEYTAYYNTTAVEQAFQGTVCEQLPTEFDGTTYSMSFPASCLDDRTSFYFSGHAVAPGSQDETAVAGPVTIHDAGEPAPAAEVSRLFGADRLATAIAISKDDWPDRQAQSVVLARHDKFPDALAGTPLAVRKNAPLLLTPSTGLAANVAEELRRVLPNNGGSFNPVYLLGGTAALSQSVEDAVKRLGYTVVRLGGADRYATAVKISEQLFTPTRIFEATGLSFQNALLSGVAAAGTGGVVVLTADGKMPAATKAYLGKYPGVERVAVGPQAGAADPSATKVAGANVYDTARLLAQRYLPSPLSTGLASGTVFADALAGGAHVGRTGGPLLLSEPNRLPAEIAAYLSQNKASIDTATLYGGPAALATSVEDSTRANLRR